jgi:hypothetical protein
LPLLDGCSLERWCTTVKHEDGLDAEPEELADAAEETDDVRVAQRIPLLVANGFQELVYPDGRINGQALAIERGEIGWACAWLDDGPEAVDTHYDTPALAMGCSVQA